MPSTRRSPAPPLRPVYGPGFHEHWSEEDLGVPTGGDDGFDDEGAAELERVERAAQVEEPPVVESLSSPAGGQSPAAMAAQIERLEASLKRANAELVSQAKHIVGLEAQMDARAALHVLHPLAAARAPHAAVRAPLVARVRRRVFAQPAAPPSWRAERAAAGRPEGVRRRAARNRGGPLGLKSMQKC